MSWKVSEIEKNFEGVFLGPKWGYDKGVFLLNGLFLLFIKLIWKIEFMGVWGLLFN